MNLELMLNEEENGETDLETEERKRRVRSYNNEEPTVVIVDGWCHQCKIKTSQLMACMNFWKKKKNGRCNGKYCPKCIEKHYGDDLMSMKQRYEMTGWVCYSCNGKCACAACKRKRGENIVVKKRTSKKQLMERERILKIQQIERLNNTNSQEEVDPNQPSLQNYLNKVQNLPVFPIPLAIPKNSPGSSIPLIDNLSGTMIQEHQNIIKSNRTNLVSFIKEIKSNKEIEKNRFLKITQSITKKDISNKQNFSNKNENVKNQANDNHLPHQNTNNTILNNDHSSPQKMQSSDKGEDQNSSLPNTIEENHQNYLQYQNQN